MQYEWTDSTLRRPETNVKYDIAIRLLVDRIESLETWKIEVLPKLLIEVYENGYKSGKEAKPKVTRKQAK